jgi:hypothetical protein
MSVWKQVTGSILIVGLLIIVLMGLDHVYGWSVGSYLENFFRGEGKKQDVEITMIANIDSKVLRMRFRVCCRNEKQRQETQNKVPRIQHELVNEVNEQQMTMAILHRDLASIRARVLRTVNGVMTDPVQSVHLVRFFFD